MRVGCHGAKEPKAGLDLTAPWLVNTFTTGAQRDSAVAMDTEGDFVVTWSAFNSATDWDVYAETFYANGAVHTSTFRVTTTSTVSPVTGSDLL